MTKYLFFHEIAPNFTFSYKSLIVISKVQLERNSPTASTLYILWHWHVNNLFPQFLALKGIFVLSAELNENFCRVDIRCGSTWFSASPMGGGYRNFIFSRCGDHPTATSVGGVSPNSLEREMHSPTDRPSVLPYFMVIYTRHIKLFT